jgi:AcrR family transcriptional regulator
VETPAQRELILEAGFARFRQHGIRRVTMDDLARELRISKKTIYRHFPDKRALVLACFEKVVGTVLPGVQAALTGKGSIRDRLRATVTLMAEVPRLITPAFIADVRADYPDVWAEIDRRRRVVVTSFERLFEEGRATGEIRPEINPKVAQRVIFAVLECVIVPEVLVTGEFSLMQAFETVATMLSRGVLADSPPARGATRRPPSRRARVHKENPR